MSATELIPIEQVDAVAVFEGDALEGILNGIKAITTAFEPDISSEAGRREIASLAHKVARSKTALDNAGKKHVAEIKAKTKAIDAKRKHARDFLDDLKAEVRQPLDEWEAEQERVRKAAEEEERRKAEEAERQRIAEIEAREREIREREEAIAAKERELREAQEAARAEEERKAREEQIRLEAEEKARREAEEKVRRAQEEAQLAEERERQAAEEAEREKAEAAAQAERDRLAAIQAEKQRQREEQEAIQREAERKAADLRHRTTIHQEVSAAFVERGFSPEEADRIVAAVAGDHIPHVAVVY